MIWTLLTVIYMAMVMIGSLQPSFQEAPPDLLKEMLHNLVHVPAYTGMALLMFAAVDSRGRRLTLFPLAAAVMVVVLYGSFIEILQGFVPGRTPSLLDVLLNSCGALLAVVVARSGMIRFSQGEPVKEETKKWIIRKR